MEILIPNIADEIQFRGSKLELDIQALSPQGSGFGVQIVSEFYPGETWGWT